MQSSHYQCLKLAAVLGFNMQSRLTPEVVIEMYAHLGLSVSPSTLVNMTKALSLESWSEVVHAADRMRMQMAYDNQDIGNPAAQPTVEKSGGFLSITSATYLLVLHCHPDDLAYSQQLWEKSILNPSRPPGSPAPYRMSFKDIVDDQWNILSTLLKNAGYGEEKHTILDKYCILVHGDLGMLEKVASLQSSRAIEESAYTRLQWVVGIPGLFHTRMACAEAVWRTHIKPASGRTDNPLSIWHLAALLRPRETGKLSGKPTFRLLHDVITHLTRALLLVCWERVIPARFSSLEDFAKSRPTWDELIALSERIAQEFVAGDDLGEIRRRGDSHRDGIREDISLFLREGLLYDDLGHATTYGHIGRVEENLAHWIPIFAAVGKHKYATALAHFLTNLRHVYPPPMSRAIRLNWLCNPTGRADGFRAVDWLVELNNMMQKTWYGGEGSHRTLEHIRRQSVLTELYRSCVVQIEKNFHLTHRTVRHHPPDMTKTLEVVAGHILPATEKLRRFWHRTFWLTQHAYDKVVIRLYVPTGYCS
ncbi:hypothetical protein EXIGLDRAFT_626678 [Exidia glandulosa HHB12029]|uniref:DUF6589 domain-containing protein n=1 Tax=Exidia glandulosa HHB12029 TaxID=1314781 RepID=A0A165CLP8_EXIGL|nr:hypothetical protein EXIGLDRAFT_626678 [Exidia glandulosa HHB12029]